MKKFILVVSIIIYTGMTFTLGYHFRGMYNEDECNVKAKKMFLDAVTHGIETGMLVVNHQKLIENCENMTNNANQVQTETNEVPEVD